MNIRQEVESAIAFFANQQVPKIPVAFEGVPFQKPQANTPYLEVVFLNSTSINATVDAESIRRWGSFQISCYCPDGRGMKQLDNLTDNIVALFPVADKSLYETFSVERPANVSPPFADAGYRWAAVRVQYRQEL